MPPKPYINQINDSIPLSLFVCLVSFLFFFLLLFSSIDTALISNISVRYIDWVCACVIQTIKSNEHCRGSSWTSNIVLADKFGKMDSHCYQVTANLAFGLVCLELDTVHVDIWSHFVLYKCCEWTPHLLFFFDQAAAVSRSLQHISGNLKLQCSNYDSAAQVFQKLVENDPEDLRALASLIIALAHINIVEAEQVTEHNLHITKHNYALINIFTLKFTLLLSWGVLSI